MGQRAMNHVGGRWGWPEGCRTVESRNPADWREVVATAPDSPAPVVDQAVAAARAALPAWRRTPPPQRGQLIRQAGDILTREKERLAQLVSHEMGKPLAEGRGDVQEAIDMAHLAAGEGRRLCGDTVPSELPDKLCLTFREPVGRFRTLEPGITEMGRRLARELLLEKSLRLPELPVEVLLHLLVRLVAPGLATRCAGSLPQRLSRTRGFSLDGRRLVDRFRCNL